MWPREEREVPREPDYLLMTSFQVNTSGYGGPAPGCATWYPDVPVVMGGNTQYVAHMQNVQYQSFPLPSEPVQNTADWNSGHYTIEPGPNAGIINIVCQGGGRFFMFTSNGLVTTSARRV